MKAPGIYTRSTNVLHYLVSDPVFLPGGAILSGTYSRDINNATDPDTTYIRNGSLICFDFTLSVYKCGFIGELDAQSAAGATLNVTTGVDTEFARQRTAAGGNVGVGGIGVPTANVAEDDFVNGDVYVGACSATGATTLTVTPNTAIEFAVNTIVTGGQPVGLLYTDNGDPVHVNDEDGNDVDVQVNVLIGGVIRGLALPELPPVSHSAMRAGIGAALTTHGLAFSFYEDLAGTGYVYAT